GSVRIPTRHRSLSNDCYLWSLKVMTPISPHGSSPPHPALVTNGTLSQRQARPPSVGSVVSGGDERALPGDVPDRV
ncbi:MAG: hypothetical protein QGI41_05850, partial [Acidimicrobiales bacterium]|nr:hypothetical protein [Acidimicrobiales bacterium]